MSGFLPWRIVHVPLTSPLPPLAAEAGVGGLYVVFWFYELVLGHVKVPTDHLPLPATAVLSLAVNTVAPAVGDRLFSQGFRADMPEVPKHAFPDAPPDLSVLLGISNPLDLLGEQLAEERNNRLANLSVSVAVCTRERPDSLRRCLDSMMALKDAPSEILVIDNAPSSDQTREVTTDYPDVRYVVEPRPGLDRARNAALAHATGDIIAFADDDVLVDPYWIRGLRRGFAEPKVMAVTGLVLPAELQTEAQMTFETFWSFNRGYRARVYDEKFMKATMGIGPPATEIGAGANMAFRREVRDLVGEFDERLDVGAAGCNGDSEYWYRILAAGRHCRYEPTAVVHHFHRREMEAFRRQLFFYMRGYAASLLVQNKRHGHFGNARRLARTLRGLLRRLRGKILRRRQPKQDTLRPELLGCLDGMKFYLMNRSLRNNTYER